ncbi:MAG: hypothetical protein ACKO7P_11240 [Bacteroidota bacterium]
MNRYNSIVTYKEKVKSDFFLWLTENFKVRKDLFFMVRKVNKRGFETIAKQFKTYDPYPGYSKYLDIKPWFIDNLWRCYLLGLNNSKPVNILDIGTGNGYFPFICKQYGHTVRTIDIGFNPIFNSLIQILDIPRRDYAVCANEPIDPFDIKFDLVTGFHTYFNGHKTENVWTSKEWEFFLKDLQKNLCNPNAAAYFIINKEHNKAVAIDSELEAFFISKGAEVDGDRVYFPSLSNI